MIEAFHRDTVKYALGILILLAFLAILGIYLLFLGRIGLGNTASLFLAGQGNGDDVNQRLASVQSEIDQTLAQVRALEAANQPAAPANPATSAAPAPKYLKISQFAASQTNVPSGTQVTFTYGAINTARGEAFRLLLQCPPGVTAAYSNGGNVCRQTINDALAIDNSGSYTVTLTNSGSQPGVIIAVLLASDITDNAIFFRDSRVLTIAVMPSGQAYNYNSYSGGPLSLTSNPSGAGAPATISFTATISNLTQCVQSHWEFGDGYHSESDPVCPNSFLNSLAKTVFETHVYNQPGTYTATFIAGNDRVSNTIYVSAPTAYYSAPSYYPTYSYNPPVYSYVYSNPQPPVYNYGLPSLPDVPTTPYNFHAVSADSNSVTLGWSAPSYGNVVNYTLYRVGTNSLPVPISTSVSACNTNTFSTCYYTISGSQTTFVDGNVSAGNTYTYRLVAGNGYGSSDYSNSLTVNLAQSNSPTVPQTFTASVNGSKIILNWTAPSSGNASNYTIYRKGGNSLTIPITISPNGCNTGDLGLCYYFANGSTFTLVDSNLAPNTAYTYRIIASNPFGISSYSDSLTVISGQSDAPIATPTLNPANRVDALNMVQLSWNSTGANYYRVYRSATRSDALPTNDDNVIGCTAGTTNPCFLNFSGDSRIYSLQAIDNQYDSSKTYYYRVKAYGAAGTSNWSNEVSAFPNNIGGSNPNPVVTADPVITSFTVDGQISPAFSSGTSHTLSYSGTNVSSYKLLVQCPNGVSVSDSNGSNICRTSSADAISVSSNGFFPIAVYNVTSGDQTVAVSILALRSNGTVSNSVTRNIIVHGTAPVVSPTPTPTPVPPPAPNPAPVTDAAITSYLINGQTSPTAASGSMLNLSYAGSNVASYKIFIQCPPNVMVPDPNTGANLCRTSQSSAVSISNSGSYTFAIYNMNNGDQTIPVMLMAFRSDGTLSNTVTRSIIVHAQPGF